MTQPNSARRSSSERQYARIPEMAVEVPHFGLRVQVPPVQYIKRHVASGLMMHNGDLALVRYVRHQVPLFELPGGGVLIGEDERDGVARETEEETGIIATPTFRLGGSYQYYCHSDGETYEQSGGHAWASTIESFDGNKTEIDHELVWMSPEEAIRHLRHDSHRYYVGQYLRYLYLGRQ
jgi:8-oxo-dGTP diphosphatase